jgi:glucose/arabinose dehydrogenase
VRQDAGYFDVSVHPDHARNGWIYLAYSDTIGEAVAGTRSASMTVIVRGRIRDGAWVDEQTIFRASPEFYYRDDTHYGCRFYWDAQGHLFFTLGERGKSLDAQDLKSPLGKIHRVMDDGSIPKDNPFVNQPGAVASIWSYGNRNPQGLQYHPVTGKM